MIKVLLQYLLCFNLLFTGNVKPSPEGISYDKGGLIALSLNNVTEYIHVSTSQNNDGLYTGSEQLDIKELCCKVDTPIIESEEDKLTCPSVEAENHYYSAISVSKILGYFFSYNKKTSSFHRYPLPISSYKYLLLQAFRI